MLDFKEWNKVFDYLSHRHDTWYVFKDFLNLVIDNFTIPGETPMFKNDDKYNDDEIEWFGELFQVYIQSMQKILEEKNYCDFLGEWWESDQNMTNKFKAQFFTPMNICELMTEMTVISEENDDSIKVMTDCCCGSGRFGLVYHDKRPYDWFFLADLDEYAVKMTIVNMLLHGMRGVVAWQNTLTQEVFGVWVVTPDLLSYCGLPYVVPYGTDLEGALKLLPTGRQVETQKLEPPIEKTEKESPIYASPTNKIITEETIGGLDKWMK